MRHSRLFAVAIVLILVASAVAMVPGSARATPTTPVVRPAASDSVQATDQYGYAFGDFYVGLGYGNVYFEANDAVDAKATVEINDQNATRDGLVNPVATFTPTFGVYGYNESYTANLFYQIPLTLQLGGWWNITINGAAAGFASSMFWVHTYYVSVYSGASAYLPGYTGTMYYYVNESVNGAPTSGLQGIFVTAQYQTTSGHVLNLPGAFGAFTAAAQGWFNFTVPANASKYSDLYFRVFANETGSSGPVYSESSVGAAPVGYVATPNVYLGDCPSVQDCQSTVFTSGEIAFASVQTWIYTPNGTAPAAGLTAQFTFRSGVSLVTPGGGYPTTVNTNISGGAEILFNASAAVFSPSQTASVNVTLTDPRNVSASYGPVVVSFHVDLATPTGPGLLVQFGSDQYYAGDTAVVNWWFGGLNASSTEGWTVQSWTVWSYSTSTGATTLLGWGIIGTATTSGSFNEAIPLGSGGDVVAQVTAYNATEFVDDFAEVSVTAPSLLINPSEYYYLPGDTVTVTLTPQGEAFQGATFFETVSSSGVSLSNTMFTGDQFSFVVPALLSSSSIAITVSAQTSTGGVIAGGSTSIYRGTGLYVTGGVQTVSNYADGSFQPGETVTIAYHVYTEGLQVLPKTMWIDFYPGSVFFYGGTGLVQFETTNPSGTFQYTIPSNAGSGVLQFFLYVDDEYCSGNCYPGNSFGIPVEPSPSVLGYELGAGSGITVGWVILLVIILVVAVVLFLVSRRHGGSSGRSGMTPYSSSSAPPPAASGSPPPPSAGWQESSSPPPGASGAPPLPQPPSSP